MKVTCPQCQTKHEITDDALLAQIERSSALRKKIASLLGKLTGGKTRLDAEGRRARAIKAVQAREAKRKISDNG